SDTRRSERASVSQRITGVIDIEHVVAADRIVADDRQLRSDAVDIAPAVVVRVADDSRRMAADVDRVSVVTRIDGGAGVDGPNVDDVGPATGADRGDAVSRQNIDRVVTSVGIQAGCSRMSALDGELAAGTGAQIDIERFEP